MFLVDNNIPTLLRHWFVLVITKKRICNYLRSRCDTGCKTVWSEVLKCTMEDSWGSFYKDYCRSDIIYMHAVSFVMSLESCDPKW